MCTSESTSPILKNNPLCIKQLTLPSHWEYTSWNSFAHIPWGSPWELQKHFLQKTWNGFFFYPRPEEWVIGSHALPVGNNPSQMKNPADEVVSLPDFIHTQFQDSDQDVLFREALGPATWLGKISLPLEAEKVIIKPYGNGGRSRMSDSHISLCSAHQCNIILPAGRADYFTRGLEGFWEHCTPPPAFSIKTSQCC